MIDPINSLASSVHANRGVYALLLGSGVSRAAQIPTGWEITLDLIRRLAALSGESPASPEAWYSEKYGTEPDFSVLLAELAKTPAERQQLLRRYWEPTQEEREQGDKAPTVAHRAIAKLVADGYIKVIITTNFDRLIESALGEEGVQPQTLSTVDQIQGAVPIVRAPYTVLKLHGDYLNTRIRNTPQELEKYPEEYNRLLDRIFDEFGLIVCGWSAEWDAALRDAIYRAVSRRYTTYWTVHGELGERGQALIAHRQAETISIQDADSFFQALADQVASIEVIPRELAYVLQDSLDQEGSQALQQSRANAAWYVDEAGRLNLNKLLTTFRTFYGEHAEHWLERFKDHSEAGPQLILQAYLQRVVDGGGRIDREYGLGLRAADLLVMWPREAGQPSDAWERFVIECKALRDADHKSMANIIDRGVAQTLDYMEQCGAKEGHLVVFDWRSKGRRDRANDAWRSERVADGRVTVWRL